MTALYWEEHSGPFSNLETSVFVRGSPYTLSSSVGWSTEYPLLHRRERAQSSPGALRWECLAWTQGEGVQRWALTKVGWTPPGAIWPVGPF